MVITLGTAFAVAGAAVALGVAGVSTALGVQSAGVAAAGAVAEKKENFKNALVLQALPQTQTIYAFITALLILMGAGLLGGGVKELTNAQGLVLFGAGLVVAITSISAISQGIVAASGIVSCAKSQDAFAPSLVFSGQCETPAIFGFILAIMLLVVGIGVLG
ncbi:MAG: V-type ATP synthase subunit K [Nanoarchaeota archaeon]|nr:V-type ATP synthase subunit K [Nanoarchaeota archaeon]MBU1005123.1 V-type ATP synthase subunit K [Nanoarchaeota archaeon]MBU1946975.1 V-type ATP synthase subunit K [Nanoarchaeota archaeon]